MARERRQRIGWGRGPTEQETEAADLRGTETVVAPYGFDTPSVPEVLQAETGQPDQAIPVEVVGPVRIDDLPSRSGGITSRQVTVTPVRALLPNDPRRKTATILAVSGDIRLGHTQNEAMSAGAGATWPQSVPFLYTASDELWAAGLLTTVEVSVIVEHWSR